ncbi:trihelix transcription factor ASIL1 [Drosophila eugracilis]|uniref:trihelix transcription factor ASIL1 n=1 Tax=Drosophila eugracilis TaxID=29029 RepID=UPI0007E7ACCA|nr:trihelix transcription factor ASIL1 [Drosophila eugracilis]
MPSRASGDISSATKISSSSRKTISGPRSKRIALSNNNKSLAVENATTTAQGQHTFPPKSEYEKFYETVFLADDPQSVEESMMERRRPGPRSKRPLHVLLDDDDSQSGSSRPSNKTVEPVNRNNGISPKPRSQGRQDKFEDYYTKTERHVWKKDAEKMLLQLWAQHLKDFRGESKNVLIYKAMAKEMSQFGPSHTELKTKMDNMSRKYRIEAERLRETGIPSKWEHFHRLQALLIGTKAVDVFEEIMCDNPAEQLFSDREESDNEEMASMNDESMAEDQKDEIELVTKAVRKRGRSSSPNLTDTQDEEYEVEDQLEESSPLPIPKYRTKRKIPVSYSERILEIEEEKLNIERKKLQVMKEALVELNSFHKDIVHLFKQKNH